MLVSCLLPVHALHSRVLAQPSFLAEKRREIPTTHLHLQTSEQRAHRLAPPTAPARRRTIVKPSVNWRTGR